MCKIAKKKQQNQRPSAHPPTQKEAIINKVCYNTVNILYMRTKMQQVWVLNVSQDTDY